MKKKITLLSLCAVMATSLCSCENLKYSLGLYNCFEPSDDFAAFNGENYYYISEGVLYEDGEKFYDDKTVIHIFANSSYVFAVSENDVTVLDFDGNEKSVLDVGSVTDIYGDDEYVFFYYLRSTGEFCNCYSIETDELFSVNKRADDEFDAKNYSTGWNGAVGELQYTHFDIGNWKVAASTTQAETENISRFSTIYLYNENENISTGLYNVSPQGDVFILNQLDITTVSADMKSENIDLPAEYNKGSLTKADMFHPSENIIITEENEGYDDFVNEPWEERHRSSGVFTYSQESGELELLLQTDETAQVVGYHNGKALVLDYEDRRLYSDDANGNVEDIYTFEKGMDTYTYFETVGDKLFVFGSGTKHASEVEMIYSCDLD